MPLPSRSALRTATVAVLKENGGSATVSEIEEECARFLQISRDDREVLYKDGPQTLFYMNLASARSDLKRSGIIDNSSGRGVWSLQTLTGDTEVDAQKVSDVGGSPDVSEVDEVEWSDRLLNVLQAMPPAGFEKLCQRILRESGFTKVEVTGRSSDGGIDGAGVLRVNLLSFQVIFQCKRYTGSVGAPTVRDFRGAMVGRADKGLIITTGNFTSEARREATRDGAPAIDLVDGSDLCNLLKSLKLGVKTEMIEAVTVQSSFFEQFT